MKQSSVVFLMYHELALPARAPCQQDAGYVRYVVTESGFRSQMQWLRVEGWRATHVSAALSSSSERTVVITFDDGAETDLLAAVPMLQQFGFSASFYVTTGFLGKPGYLNRTQVREIADAGFEIGCHSKTHAYLSDQNDTVLELEISDPKKELEDITGRQVEHFSCPGGRYDQRVLATAQRCGYRTVATSRAIANAISAVSFELGRVAVMRNTTLSSYQQICRGSGLWKIRATSAISNAAKSLLGNTAYDGIRARLLRHGNSSQQ